MEAKQGLLLVICSMILAGEVACFPKDIRAQTSITQEDVSTLLSKQDDWPSILKVLPGLVKTWLLPIIRKILTGVKESKDPVAILLDIITFLEKGVKKEKEKEKEEEKETGKEEGKNEEKNKGNEEESEEKEPKEEPGSGNTDTEREDLDITSTDSHEF